MPKNTLNKAGFFKKILSAINYATEEAGKTTITFQGTRRIEDRALIRKMLSIATGGDEKAFNFIRDDKRETYTATTSITKLAIAESLWKTCEMFCDDRKFHPTGIKLKDTDKVATQMYLFSSEKDLIMHGNKDVFVAGFSPKVVAEAFMMLMESHEIKPDPDAVISWPKGLLMIKESDRDKVRKLEAPNGIEKFKPAILKSRVAELPTTNTVAIESPPIFRTIFSAIDEAQEAAGATTITFREIRTSQDAQLITSFLGVSNNNSKFLPHNEYRAETGILTIRINSTKKDIAKTQWQLCGIFCGDAQDSITEVPLNEQSQQKLKVYYHQYNKTYNSGIPLLNNRATSIGLAYSMLMRHHGIASIHKQTLNFGDLETASTIFVEKAVRDKIQKLEAPNGIAVLKPATLKSDEIGIFKTILSAVDDALEAAGATTITFEGIRDREQVDLAMQIVDIVTLDGTKLAENAKIPLQYLHIQDTGTLSVTIPATKKDAATSLWKTCETYCKDYNDPVTDDPAEGYSYIAKPELAMALHDTFTKLLNYHGIPGSADYKTAGDGNGATVIPKRLRGEIQTLEAPDGIDVFKPAILKELPVVLPQKHPIFKTVFSAIDEAKEQDEATTIIFKNIRTSDDVALVKQFFTIVSKNDIGSLDFIHNPNDKTLTLDINATRQEIAEALWKVCETLCPDETDAYVKLQDIERANPYLVYPAYIMKGTNGSEKDVGTAFKMLMKYHDIEDTDRHAVEYEAEGLLALQKSIVDKIKAIEVPQGLELLKPDILRTQVNPSPENATPAPQPPDAKQIDRTAFDRLWAQQVEPFVLENLARTPPNNLFRCNLDPQNIDGAYKVSFELSSATGEQDIKMLSVKAANLEEALTAKVYLQSRVIATAGIEPARTIAKNGNIILKSGEVLPEGAPTVPQELHAGGSGYSATLIFAATANRPEIRTEVFLGTDNPYTATERADFLRAELENLAEHRGLLMQRFGATNNQPLSITRYDLTHFLRERVGKDNWKTPEHVPLKEVDLAIIGNSGHTAKLHSVGLRQQLSPEHGDSSYNLLVTLEVKSEDKTLMVKSKSIRLHTDNIKVAQQRAEEYLGFVQTTFSTLSATGASWSVDEGGNHQELSNDSRDKLIDIPSMVSPNTVLDKVSVEWIMESKGFNNLVFIQTSNIREENGQVTFRLNLMRGKLDQAAEPVRHGHQPTFVELTVPAQDRGQIAELSKEAGRQVFNFADEAYNDLALTNTEIKRKHPQRYNHATWQNAFFDVVRGALAERNNFRITDEAANQRYKDWTASTGKPAEGMEPPEEVIRGEEPEQLHENERDLPEVG